MSGPGLQIISKDLGTGQVTGDIGRVVEGYGGALGQMTQEVLRMMRESKIHVVWLFDESESMKDDQKEIRERFYKVYEELGLVAKHDSRVKLSEETLLTSVVSFGERVTEQTSKPTADRDEIKKAIDKIGVDESGKENTCGAIMSTVGKYGQMARRQNRRLVLIVVTDESGDDGEQVEEAIQRCRAYDSPVYFLGHYSVFGYPYAHMRWVDPSSACRTGCESTGVRKLPCRNACSSTACMRDGMCFRAALGPMNRPGSPGRPVESSLCSPGMKTI
jgi:hypothetical protein